MSSVVTAYVPALPEATSTSLSLPESLTFEQWEEIGSELANRARKLNWWIGDWWAAGHHRYGERARLAARGLFGKEFKTLANIASVCRAFEPSRRREHLSWSHHAEAAALSPNAADMLLDLAERDRLSKAQVRSAVTTIRGGPPSRTAPDAAAVAGLFRTYNRLPEAVRLLVAQAFAAVAASGAEIDPATGNPKIEGPADEAPPLHDKTPAEDAFDLAQEMAVERYIDYDFPPEDMTRPVEAVPDVAFDLDLGVEKEPIEGAPDTLPDGSETSVVLPPAERNAAFDADAAMELEPAMNQQPDEAPAFRAFQLGPETEEGDGQEELRKASASATESWLLP